MYAPGHLRPRQKKKPFVYMVSILLTIYEHIYQKCYNQKHYCQEILTSAIQRDPLTFKNQKYTFSGKTLKHLICAKDDAT